MGMHHDGKYSDAAVRGFANDQPEESKRIIL